MKKVLVLAPHADDEILGCGGTMSRHCRQGDEIHICILTNASVGDPELYSKDKVQKTRNEAIEAIKSIGIKNKIIFRDFPAPKLEQYPQYKIASELNKIFNLIQPEILYIPHKGDLHMDHGAIYNAALVASRPFSAPSIKEIYSYETLSETEWGHPTVEKAFIPNTYVKLEETDLENKIKAMNLYSSQIRDFPHPRSEKAIECLAKLRGSCINTYFAEAFMLIRLIQ